MAYETFTTFLNRTGQDAFTGMLPYVAEVSPIFIPLLLFVAWLLMLGASFFGQFALRGEADFPACLAVAGIFVAVLSVILGLSMQVVDPITFSICFLVALFGVAVLYFSNPQ